MFKLFKLAKGSGRKRHNPIMPFSFTVITLSCVLIAAFLVIDSDYLYYNWFLSSRESNVTANDGSMIYTVDGELVSLESDAEFGSEGSTYYGLNMMIINKMAEGYCKDYLVIANMHATGEALQTAYDIKDVDGNTLSLPISHLVGTSIAESSTWGGTAIGIPKSLIKIGAYGKPSGSLLASQMTFYSLNHNSYTKASSIDLYEDYWTLASDAPTFTTFQVRNSYFALPAGQGTKQSGVNVSLPSRLNGYGYSEGTVRTYDQTDAAFLPDLFAYVVQQALEGVANYPDGVFTSEGLALFSSIQHNSGGGAIINKMVYGQSSSPSTKLDDTEQKTLTAKYLNEVAEIFNMGTERDGETVSNINVYESSSWRSYLAGVLISLGGYRVGSYCDSTAYNYLTGNSARRDALYLGLTGEYISGVSDSRVREAWNKYSSFDLDGKYLQGTINVSTGNSGYLYKTHTDAKITGANGK